MPKSEDDPVRAEADTKKASDKASHLEYVIALAGENLEHAEQVLVYAKESNNPKEIADAQWERDDCAETLAGLKGDLVDAFAELDRVHTYWGF